MSYLPPGIHFRTFTTLPRHTPIVCTSPCKTIHTQATGTGFAPYLPTVVPLAFQSLEQEEGSLGGSSDEEEEGESSQPSPGALSAPMCFALAQHLPHCARTWN